MTHRESPMPEISINTRQYFDEEGESIGKCYEIDVSSAIESNGIIVLDDVADLFRLRTAINNYITENALANPYQEQPTSD